MKRSSRLVSLLVPAVCGAFLFLSHPVQPGDWATWRGPDQDGSVSGGGVFNREEFGLKIEWKQPIGSGYSGISIVGDRLVTMDTDGEVDSLVALSASDGTELWRYEIEPMYQGHDGSDDGPISTPVVDDGVVYGLSAKGKLFAVRLENGKELWASDIRAGFDAHVPVYGFTTEPLVLADHVYLQTGGPAGRSVTAFDKKTGKAHWSSGDAAVGYQSPTVATLAGRRQILAVGNRIVAGLVPESGDVLWSHEYSDSDEDGSSQPVLLGDDTFMLVLNDDSVAYRLKKNGEAYSLDERWRSTAINGSLATPVVYEGHLYGFDGNFLTCIDIANGEKVWKSRPPGGNGLIRVDGHLVIFDASGRLVIVEATPEGYREKTAIQLSERSSYTYPSFADGSIFVRNLSEIFRVGVTRTAGEVVEQRKPAVPASEFASFVLEVEASDNKRAMIDDFMNAQDGFPVVEGNELVHFIYRGDAEDVAITGNMTDWFVEEPLDRITGTDFRYKTYRFEPGTRLEYRFNVDFENLGPDPLNPRRVPGNFGDQSELGLPGWTAPDHVRAYRGDRPGTLDKFQFESAILGNEREITVYLPPGYADSGESYPVLLVNEGEEWLQFGNVPNSLNNLIGERVAPVIVVFVNSLGFGVAREEQSGAKRADYARMQAEELLPRIESTYRTIADREARAITGYTGGAYAALYTVLEYPELFGHAGMQSLWLQPPLADELMDRLAKPSSPKPGLHLTWYHYDLKNPNFGIDLAADSTEVAEAIEKAGYEFGGGEVTEGAGWGGWRAHFAEMLEAFFPFE